MTRPGHDGAPGRADAAQVAVRLALAGAAVWSLALLAGPALRPDLNLVSTHPETYARGSWGLLMRLGYAGIAIGGWSAAFLARRYPIPAVLLAGFAAGALAIGVLPPTGAHTDGLADQVFPYLQTAPLAFLPAVAWISWRTRRRLLVALAALIWLLFLPLVTGDPATGGIINRAADLTMGAWIAAFAWSERDHGS